MQLVCPAGTPAALRAAVDAGADTVYCGFRNETNARADYILPATTMYEREDFLLPFQALFTTPFKQATEAVIPPQESP